MPDTERWIYGGVRVLNGKRVHGWVDPSGNELLFKRAVVAAVSYYYEVEVTHDGDKTRRGTPQHTGDQVDQETRRKLYAQHVAAKTRLAKLTQERNAAKQDEFRDAMVPLVT